MFLNKQNRNKYVGFNDFWYVVVGLLVVSFIIDYIFNNSFKNASLADALLSWGVSLAFSIANWLSLRFIIVSLRKKFPKFKDTKKRILILVCSFLIGIFTIDFLGDQILSAIFKENYNPIDKSRVLTVVILLTFMVTAIYEAIYFYIQLQKNVREEEQANQAIVQAELDALRNQARPHFLFNSLNTLRDIIDQNPKEDAKEFVDKLSNVYRFILESGNSHIIPIQDELKFAHSYIHIQSERFGDNLQVDWQIPDAYLNKMIVPMSLQFLLENAIKHNVISRSKPLKILVIAKDGYLQVDNPIQPKSTKLPSTHLGLKNIKKRYDLISEKSVQIQDDAQTFSVALPILEPAQQKASYAHSNY